MADKRQRVCCTVCESEFEAKPGTRLHQAAKKTAKGQLLADPPTDTKASCPDCGKQRLSKYRALDEQGPKLCRNLINATFDKFVCSRRTTIKDENVYDIVKTYNKWAKQTKHPEATTMMLAQALTARAARMPQLEVQAYWQPNDVPLKVQDEPDMAPKGACSRSWARRWEAALEKTWEDEGHPEKANLAGGQSDFAGHGRFGIADFTPFVVGYTHFPAGTLRPSKKKMAKQGGALLGIFLPGALRAPRAKGGSGVAEEASVRCIPLDPKGMSEATHEGPRVGQGDRVADV
eukprot:gene856-2781_t